jgi:hypothetical protein
MSINGCARALSGWLAGCGAATAVIVGLPVIVAVSSLPRKSLGTTSVLPLLGPSLLVFVITCVMTAFPAMLMIWLSVELRLRSVVFFGAAGAALGAFSIALLVRSAVVWTSNIGALFAVAGFAAGVAYWFVAGRHVICERAARSTNAHLPLR